MSDRERADLKQALRSLDVARPLRIPREIGFKAPLAPSQAEPQGSRRSPAVEQSRSNTNSVQNPPGAELTRSNLDPVKAGQGDLAPTRNRAPFTAVPHALLRGECRFDEPIDFMVYLHLFTYSHGFGRQDANMSHSQLERFTGATRNTIRRSLERLTRAGWVRCVEEYECARMSRKWRVALPKEEPASGRSQTRSGLDPVKSAPGEERNEPGSKVPPVTGSNSDPFIETRSKETPKHSLSPKSQAVQEYFRDLKPQRKRESEWQAYREILTDFSEEQVASCLRWLQGNGMPPTGTPCHSPMAYLAKAMNDVLAAAQEGSARERDRQERQQERDRLERIEAQRVEAEEARWRLKEQAFVAAFPDLARRVEVFEGYCRGTLFSPESEAGRAYSINRWCEAAHQGGDCFSG